MGVHEGDIRLIWGYTEGCNFVLGVREYQKVENPWSTLHITLFSPCKQAERTAFDYDFCILSMNMNFTNNMYFIDTLYFIDNMYFIDNVYFIDNM